MKVYVYFCLLQSCSFLISLSKSIFYVFFFLRCKIIFQALDTIRKLTLLSFVRNLILLYRLSIVSDESTERIKKYWTILIFVTEENTKNSYFKQKNMLLYRNDFFECMKNNTVKIVNVRINFSVLLTLLLYFFYGCFMKIYLNFMNYEYWFC